MNERFENIDYFLSGNPDPEELKEFERRIIADPEFAEEVSFYLATINALRGESDARKKERFRRITLK